MELPPLYQRKYSASSLLSLAWKEYKENFWTILLIILTIYVPANLIWILANYSTSQQSLLQSLPILIPAGLIVLAIGLISELAIPYAIKSSIEGKRISYIEALKKAAEKWRSGIYVEIMMIIFLIPLFLFLVLPGILYSVYWMFGLYAVMLSNKTGKSSLDHSKKIVKGRWWTVLLYGIFFALIAFIPLIPVYIFQALTPENILTDLFYGTLINIVFSFYSVALVLFYLNLEATEIKG